MTAGVELAGVGVELIPGIAGSDNITIGTSTITGGTTGRVLRDNAGVIGEYTITGTAGSVVMSTSPTITTPTISGAETFATATSGPVLKQGANGRVGTFTLNGATPVTVSNTSVAVSDAIIFSLNTVGGTVGAYPTIQTITAATGFTVAGSALDTSVYNYAIIKNAA